ncbi:MAG: AAA family ATPase [Vicinamibacterales bacterium]
MIVEDQQALIEFLSQPGAYGLGPDVPVARVDTHSAVVFLAGAQAYKLKRAVRYDYLDFSTAERRRRFCDAEVALNRRTAPAIYDRCVPITREAGGRHALDGQGPPVDWVVRMRRFPDEDLLDRVAARGALDLALMPRLADAIARLHRTAEPRPDKGGAAGMAWVVAGNERGLEHEGGAIFEPALRTRVVEATRRELARTAARLDDRRRDGAVRVCHGDLHLGNIVLLDGEPTLFDAIEFNDDISCIDVLYDVAFLLTDLWRLGLRQHANALFNRYVSGTFGRAGDYEALTLLPLFLSCRSTVRAKTSATASRLQPDETHAAPLAAAARVYLAEADELLHPPAPRLIAVGGLSGSGKSTVARQLAAAVGGAPGALVLRTDVIRKQLCGVGEETRLGPDAYADEMNVRVYTELLARAAAALRAGHAVIADGVFARVWERAALERVARDARVDWNAAWLDASTDLRAERIRGRQGDASDATVEILAAQAVEVEPPDTWARIEAAGETATVVARVAERLGLVR